MSRFLEWKNENIEVCDEFLFWYKRFDPDGWDSEYSGTIYALFKAWEAGRAAGWEDGRP